MRNSNQKLYIIRFSIPMGNKNEAFIAQTMEEADKIRQACATLKLKPVEKLMESERLYDLKVTIFENHSQEFRGYTASEIKEVIGDREFTKLEPLLGGVLPTKTKSIDEPNKEFEIKQRYPDLGHLFVKNDITP